MQTAATDDRHFNYFPLLSGTDYPVQPTSYIETFFRRHNGTEFINFGDGTQTRDFTFINDVIDALGLAAKTELCGEVFNVGGGSQISVNELVEEIERITEKRAAIDRTIAQKGDVKDTQADIS